MRKVQVVVLILILISIIFVNPISINAVTKSQDVTDSEIQVSEFAIPSDYVNSDYVRVESNADFATQGFTGSGTSGDPYVLEGYYILNESRCVYIKDATAHFVIRNCMFDSPTTESGSGVYLRNAVNGVVEDCIALNKSSGVVCTNSNGTIIRNNTFIDCRTGWQGSDSNNTLLEYNNCSGNRIHGFSLQGFDYYNTTVRNNTISGGMMGILVQVNGANIIDNTVSDCDDGVELYGGANYTTIENNKIRNCRYSGIRLTGDYYYTIIRNNTLTDCSGIRFVGRSSVVPITVTNNTVNGKPLGFFHNNDSLSIDGSDYGQVVLFNCTGIDINGGSFVDSGDISFLFCSNCSLKESTISNGGVNLYKSDNCSFFNNDIDGFVASGSEFTVIANNTISSSEVSFFNSNYSNIIGNELENLDSGINIRMSEYVNIFNNSIANIDSNGISLSAHYIGSNYCNISYNTISNTSFGIRILDSWNSTVSFNTISDCSYGCYMLYIKNLNLYNNTLENNGIWVNGHPDSMGDLYVHDNTVNGKPLGCFFKEGNMILDGNSYGQILLIDCENVTVNDGVFENTTVGIFNTYSSDCIWNSTVLKNNVMGAYVLYSYNFTLVNSTISNISNDDWLSSAAGITIDYSDKCTISGNSFLSTKMGLDSCCTSNTIFQFNTIQGASGGGYHRCYSRPKGPCFIASAYIISGNNLTLVNNTIVDNGAGLVLEDSLSCKFYNNIVTNNTNGGITFDDNQNCLLVNNTIAWNTPWDAKDDGGINNKWDDGSTWGNLWGNYSLVGPVHIDGDSESVDHYPRNVYGVFGVYDTTTTTTTTTSTTTITTSTTTSDTVSTLVIEPIMLAMIAGGVGLVIVAIIIRLKRR